MDTFRYVMAVLILLGIPPSIGYWYIVHPFIGFWRRRGLAVTVGVLAVFYLASITGLYLSRGFFLVGDYGTDWTLVALGVALAAVSGFVQYHRAKHLKFKTLSGVPEIDPEKHGGKLLTEGIYGRMRHPRYVEFALGIVAWSLVINYLAIYVLAAASVVLLYPIVIFEERELESRFGAAYVEYRSRVPRFLPRF